jgi:hypothetical protein
MSNSVTLQIPSLKNVVSTFKQPKFWVMVIVAGLQVANHSLGLHLSTSQLTDLTGTGIAWILGESFVHGSFVRGASTPATSATTTGTSASSSVVTPKVS